MSLPLTRSTTYAPNSQLKSSDMNALQDMVVGGRHGEIKTTVPINGGYSTFGTVIDKGVISTGASQEHDVELPLPIGATITGYVVRVTGRAAVDQVQLYEHNGVTNSLTSLATVGTDGTATLQQVAKTGLSVAVVSERRYYVRFVAGGAGLAAYTCEVVYYK